jgi:hypothetical protein
MYYRISKETDFKVGDKVRHLASGRVGKVADVHEDYHGRTMMEVVFGPNDTGIYVNDKQFFELDSVAEERHNEWKDVWDESSN